MKKPIFFFASLCLILGMAAVRAASGTARIVVLISEGRASLSREGGIPEGERVMAEKLSRAGYDVIAGARAENAAGRSTISEPHGMDKAALDRLCRLAKADFALVGTAETTGEAGSTCSSMSNLRLFRARDAVVCSRLISSRYFSDPDTVKAGAEAMSACAKDIVGKLTPVIRGIHKTATEKS